MSLKALLFASTAMAAALPVAVPAPAPANLTARQDGKPTVWSSPDGGNTQAVFGDAKVYTGGCTPDMIMDTVAENCYTQGFCNSDSWTIECVGGDRATHTVTITAPEGQYQTWIHNGMIDGIRAALKTDGLVTSESIYAQSGGGCVGCTWTGEEITVYHMPSTIGLSHANDGTVPDVLTLKIEYDDSDGGLCEILTTIGGAVAGSVNGIAGGVFSVAGLACG